MNRVAKRRLWKIFFLLLPLLVTLVFPEIGSRVKAQIIDVLRFPLKTFSNLLSLRKTIFPYQKILKENKELKDKLEALNSQIISLKEASFENERLRGLLFFKKQFSYATVPAEVIGRDTSNWMGFIIIDKGSNDDVKINMPAISTSGLVGKVCEVGQRTSRVLLITHPDSRVTAVIQRSREEGVVAGTIDGKCKMLYLSKSCDISKEDIVMSSGLGGVYPRGLVIGEIVELREDLSGLSRYAEIKPAVSLSGLEKVLIITNEMKLQ